MTDKEALKLALEAITTYLSESPDSSEEAVEGLWDAVSVARRVLAQPEQEPVMDLHFYKQVLSVAIAMLYDHYKQDVINTFSIEELSEVVDLSESLQPRQVEDIYKEMWDMLTTPPPPQRTWVGSGDLEDSNAYQTPPAAQRTWVGLMRGVRVEGDTVVITVKGGNDEARALCYALIGEMEKNT